MRFVTPFVARANRKIAGIELDDRNRRFEGIFATENNNKKKQNYKRRRNCPGKSFRSMWIDERNASNRQEHRPEL